MIEKLVQVSETHHTKTQEVMKELSNQYKKDLEKIAELQHEKQITSLKEVQQHYNKRETFQEEQLNDYISRYAIYAVQGYQQNLILKTIWLNAEFFLYAYCRFSELDIKLQEVIQHSNVVNDKLVKDIKESIKHIPKQLKLEIGKSFEKQVSCIILITEYHISILRTRVCIDLIIKICLM